MVVAFFFFFPPSIILWGISSLDGHGLDACIFPGTLYSGEPYFFSFLIIFGSCITVAVSLMDIASCSAVGVIRQLYQIKQARLVDPPLVPPLSCMIINEIVITNPFGQYGSIIDATHRPQTEKRQSCTPTLFPFDCVPVCYSEPTISSPSFYSVTSLATSDFFVSPAFRI